MTGFLKTLLLISLTHTLECVCNCIAAQKDPLHKLFKMMLQHFLTAAIHDLTSFRISCNWPSDPRNTIYTLYFCRFSLSQDMFAKLISLSEKIVMPFDAK